VWNLPEFPRLRSYNLVLTIQPDASEAARGRHDGEKTFTNSLGMKLVQVPALAERVDWASIDGLDEELFTEDEASDSPLYFGQTEVTVGQFRKFVQATGYKTEAERGEGGSGWNEDRNRFEAQNKSYSWKSTGFEQTDSHPVVNITWNDAVAFCNWLSKREGRKYRLPTEAEWEFACRGGTKGRWTCGDNADNLALVGNVADGSAKTKFASWQGIEAHDGYVFTSPVGSFQANPYGLYDVHGNVWEWCADSVQAKEVHHEHRHSDVSSGCSIHRECLTRTKSVTYNALRGGSWLSVAAGADAGYRNFNSPSLRSVDLGFRVVLVP
jgi:formylglycine-generating enzyme required for sulfatase activity